MSYRIYDCTITTNASGNMEILTPPMNGRIVQIHYIRPGAGGYTAAQAIDFDYESIPGSLINRLGVVGTDASLRFAPTCNGQNVGGSDSTGRYQLAIANERIRIRDALGAGGLGNATTGRFVITIEGQMGAELGGPNDGVAITGLLSAQRTTAGPLV